MSIPGAERVEPLGSAFADWPAVECPALGAGDGAHAVRLRSHLLVADPDPVVLVVDGVYLLIEISPDPVDHVLDLPQRPRLPEERLEDLVGDNGNPS